MFWGSNCWRSRNHSFYFCKVYVSLTACILTRIIVSQLDDMRKNNPNMLFRWTFHFFPFPGYNLGAWRGNGGRHKYYQDPRTSDIGNFSDTTDRNHRFGIYKMVGLVIALNWPVLYLTSLGNSNVSTIRSCADTELGEEHVVTRVSEQRSFK